MCAGRGLKIRRWDQRVVENQLNSCTVLCTGIGSLSYSMDIGVAKQKLRALLVDFSSAVFAPSLAVTLPLKHISRVTPRRADSTVHLLAEGLSKNGYCTCKSVLLHCCIPMLLYEKYRNWVSMKLVPMLIFSSIMGFTGYARIVYRR